MSCSFIIMLCHYAECFMLNVVMLNVVMLSVVAPGAIHGKIHTGELKVLLENIRLG